MKKARKTPKTEIQEIDGNHYMSIPLKPGYENTCHRCVGDVDMDLCEAMGSKCGVVDIVWIKVPPPKTNRGGR